MFKCLESMTKKALLRLLADTENPEFHAAVGAEG